MGNDNPSVNRQLLLAQRGGTPVSLVLHDGAVIPCDVVTRIDPHPGTPGSSTTVEVAVTDGGVRTFELGEIAEVLPGEPAR